MRPYRGLQPTKHDDVKVRSDMEIIDYTFRDIFDALKRLTIGTNLDTAGGGPTPPPSTGADDGSFWKLLGRAGGQTGYGGTLSGNEAQIVANAVDANAGIFHAFDGPTSTFFATIGVSPSAPIASTAYYNSVEFTFEQPSGSAADDFLLTQFWTPINVDVSFVPANAWATSLSLVAGFFMEGIPNNVVGWTTWFGIAPSVNMVEYWSGYPLSLKSGVDKDGKWFGGTTPGYDAGGWTDAGTVVHTTTATDAVAIGTSSPTANVQLTLAAQAGQTADILDIVNSTPTTLFQIDKSGNFLFGTGASLGTGFQYAQFGVTSGGAFSGAGVLLTDASGFHGEFQTSGSGLTADCVWQFPDGGGSLMTNTSTTSVSNKTLTGSTNKIQLDSGGTAGTAFRKGSSGLVNLNWDLGPITASRKLTHQDFSAVMPMVGKTGTAAAAGTLAGVDATAQTADIASTNLATTPPAGMFLVCATLSCTTSDAAAGTVTLTLGWTDSVGATTWTTFDDGTTSLTLTTTGRKAMVKAFHVASGSVTYATSHTGSYGTAQYNLRVRIVALN